MKAFLFDLDGVIVDSEWINVGSGVKAFRDFGINLTPAERKFIIGRHPVDYCKTFSKKYSFDFDKFRPLQRAYYLEMYQRAKLYPFARQLIRKLKKKGCLALVTTSPKKLVNIALKKFNLQGLFDVFVTFEDAQRRKPAPDVYLLAAKRLKVKPKDCVVFEDSIPGVAAAKKARMVCIAVTNTNPASKLNKADLIVKKLNDKRIWDYVDF
ncbi:HAD family phosphatase [Candidatus Woesearchaeota archaeon]|nr:HAD family phosphatase [Candidatus Woesearchaeota archaeon]MBW3016700.1 HAD family phosphatase [Candidatus Woesearchaeota archaeon]